jgi:predicted amino acid racemase
VIIIAILCVVGFYFSNHWSFFLDDGEEIVKDDKGVHIEEIHKPNKLAMVIPSNASEIDGKHCTMWAKLYEEPENFDQYKVHTQYFDSSDKLIGEWDTNMKDVPKEGDKFLIINNTSDKIIDFVEFKIFDENGNEVFYHKCEK